MFTGLIECLGRLTAVSQRGHLRELTIQAPEIAFELSLGDSVAIDGICQTVTALAGPAFRVQATGDTLVKTTLASWRPGRPLNLERALRAGDRLDGHLVQGHVQGVATVRSLTRSPTGCFLEITLAEDFAARVGSAVVPEGSIAIDGISLTVAEVRGSPMVLRVSLIPHTLEHSTLGGIRAGREVNIETDLALRRGAPEPAVPAASGLTAEKLKNWGYP